MADQFQIPQRNPQYVAPVAPPTDLIQALYNRPKPGEIAAGEVSDAVKALYGQYIQQQQAKVAAIRQIGPTMANQIYGSNIQPPPQPDQTQQPGIIVQPSNGPATPSTPPPQQVQGLSQDQYHAIAAHLGVQPNFASYQQSQSAPVAAPATAGNPMMGVHAQNIQAGQAEMARNAQMGEYGMDQNKAVMDRLSGEKSLMEGEQFNVGQQRQQDQFNENKRIQEDEFNRNKALEVGGKQSEVQQKYGAQDLKTQQGIKALQDFSDAWENVPKSMKGPGMGSLTSKAGSLFSGVAPDVTTFNKIRENTATALATALLPENARANPLMVKELVNTLPSLQSSPEEKRRVMENFASQLTNNADLNYQLNQQAAQSFGGNVKKTKMAPLSVGKQAMVPDGRITVVSPTGQVGHIPQAQLKAALAKGYKQQ